ncbi:growth arrest-specific protein 1-like [Centruroides vittatus]|uniref:growth arrest-specific protein 1-like n=1 Tax=Centruroides vittatus TaxID=120091 RepID=UPI00350F83D8
MIVLFVWILFGRSQATRSSCDSAQNACSSDTECSGSLHTYMIDCGDFMAGRSLGCSQVCKKSVRHLTETRAGKSLMDCNCGDDEFCLLSRNTMKSCTQEDEAKDCGEASWVCASDYNCSRALGYYRSHCASVVHLGTCSDSCRRSLDILRSLDRSREMFECQCRGVEDYPCHQTVTDTCREKWNTVEPEAVQSDAPESLSRWIACLHLFCLLPFFLLV